MIESIEDVHIEHHTPSNTHTSTTTTTKTTTNMDMDMDDDTNNNTNNEKKSVMGKSMNSSALHKSHLSEFTRVDYNMTEIINQVIYIHVVYILYNILYI